ncbi:hypothetical protein PCANC_13934 [Puccinia coronata f. sp. avenae]|uniref:Uncharacterized protein n=1 Tax=Puccinia coronata f. sp. avenae TaxID=200324 RepID=A0A2N5SUP4_9BASI|nr:hypothetical protein PCANC_13934 [Puccinia coronata f. sp. avenae]
MAIACQLLAAKASRMQLWKLRHGPIKAPAGGSDRPVQSVRGTGHTGPAGTGRTNLSDHAAVPLPDPSSHGFNACLNSPAGTRFALADLVDNNNNWLKPLDLDLGGGAMTRR